MRGTGSPGPSERGWLDDQEAAADLDTVAWDLGNRDAPATTHPDSGAAIRVRGLSHTYRLDGRPVPVLHGVDLEVPPGGYVSIQGPSGAGKSTLLSLLGGLEPPQEGDVMLGPVNLAGLGRDELAAYRRETVGFVFQHFGLLETLSARENVELATALAGAGRAERRRRSSELLEAVGLADRASHRPAQLSGGERQRVALARALVNRPRLILADEPTGNLDEDSAVRVVELLEALHRERGSTLVLVTHNRWLAARAEHRMRLEEGRLMASEPGSTDRHVPWPG